MAKPPAAPMSRAELQQKIVALAWTDDAFRKAFLANPKREFEERLGARLPAGLKITAHAEDERHLHFVIPPKPPASGELDDADLERVAGGVDATLTLVGASILSAGALSYTVQTHIEEGKKRGW